MINQREVKLKNGKKIKLSADTNTLLAFKQCYGIDFKAAEIETDKYSLKAKLLLNQLERKQQNKDLSLDEIELIVEEHQKNMLILVDNYKGLTDEQLAVSMILSINPELTREKIEEMIIDDMLDFESELYKAVFYLRPMLNIVLKKKI